MKAIVVREFGGPDQLHEDTVPTPPPGPGEVAIDVHYAGVNFADVMDRQGTYGHGATTPFVPGLDVSGTVRSVGEGVEGLSAGQFVIAFMTNGGYADVAVADQRLVVPVDQADLALLDQAGAHLAALPTIFSTAHLVLDRLVRPRAGETLVVHSAAGGTGGAVAAVAKQAGVRLVGTVGEPSKLGAAGQAGYDYVVLREEFVEAVKDLTSGRGVQAVLDTVGGQTQVDSFESLAPGGLLVVMGNAAGFDALDLTPRSVLAANRGVAGFSLTRLAKAEPHVVADAMRQAVRQLLEGVIAIPALKVIPRSRAVEANAELESGLSVGKYVMEMRS